MHTISRWDDIRVLNACLEHGSLSGAAVALGVQQSTVSRRLAALEGALGYPLFTRNADGVIPTALAEKIRVDAAAMEDHSRALERHAAGYEPSPSGTVRIALVEPVAVYAVLPALDELTERFAALRIELLTGYTSSDLTRGETDIALRFFRTSAGNLITKKLTDYPLEVVASRSYVQRHGKPTLASGRWVNVVLPFVRTPEQAWYEKHVAVPPWLQTNSYITATEAVVRGQAVGIVTSITRALHREKLLAFDLGVPCPPPLEMWLVTHRALRNVPRIAAVWDWLSRRLRATS